jgi:Phage tail lysozyme
MAGVTPAQIYKELISLGASTNQAIGIMANMINESGFNPEAVGDQGTSFGLVQQHGAYGYLVTGNPVADMQAQLKLLVQNGGLGAAGSGSASSAAGNFAANYEKCVGCQPGGSQYNARVGNVGNLLNALATGKWPTSAGSGGGGGSSGGGGVGSLTAAQESSGYSSFFSNYGGGIQTTSLLGGIFSTIEDPFKAIGDAVTGLVSFFSNPNVGFLDVFKTLVTGIDSLVNGFDTIIKDVLWLFNPSHWIRVFCFVFGVFVTIPALYALMHTGTGDMYLAMGIALTTLAGILFFLAFHNLPYEGPGNPASAQNVIDFQALLAYISEGIRTGAAPSGGSGTAGTSTADTLTPGIGSGAGAPGATSGPGSGASYQPVANATGIFPTISNISPTPSGNPPSYTNYLL